jgi:hypothetical protein
MSQTRQSKKHLYNVHDVLIDLDTNTKGISQYAFLCNDKTEAIMARNNIQNSILKGHLKHKYTTKTVNSVDLNGHVLWFCIVYKLEEINKRA